MAKTIKEPTEGKQAVSYLCECGKPVLLIHENEDEKIKILSFCWNCLKKIDNIFNL